MFDGEISAAIHSSALIFNSGQLALWVNAGYSREVANASQLGRDAKRPEECEAQSKRFIGAGPMGPAHKPKTLQDEIQGPRPRGSHALSVMMF